MQRSLGTILFFPIAQIHLRDSNFNLRKKFGELNFQKKLCQMQGSNSRPFAPQCAPETPPTSAFLLPWYSCWVEGLPEAVSIFMARVWTQPIQGTIHPNNTGPTARLKARRYRARTSVDIFVTPLQLRPWQNCAVGECALPTELIPDILVER